MDTHKALSTDSPLSRCLLVLFSLLLTLLTVAELTLVVLLQLKVCFIKYHFCELLYDISIQQYFLFKEVEITPLVSIGQVSKDLDSDSILGPNWHEISQYG